MIMRRFTPLSMTGANPNKYNKTFNYEECLYIG